MHVGMFSIFQGYGGSLSDQEVYAADIHLADLAEPLGFESVWGTEHHFSRYQMCPDVIQFLTYMAGRTSTIKLGSMVAVLPWHEPVRIAEQISMLDTLSGGRVILGIGRGTGRIEFEGLGLDMTQARQRFKEATEAILGALEQGYMEYDGEIIHQPRRDIRPEPSRSFKGRVYSATVSPESAQVMAQLGTGMMIVPQKPWHLVAQDCVNYRETFTSAFGVAPPPPIAGGWTLVDENEDRAAELAHEHLGAYWRSVVEHYEFDQPFLKDTPGYEFHGKIYERLTAPGGMERMTDFYVDLQPWGTPEQVYEKIKKFASMTGIDGFVGVFRYGGMTRVQGEHNMRLFASEVMPELKKLPQFVAPEAAPALA